MKRRNLLIIPMTIIVMIALLSGCVAVQPVASEPAANVQETGEHEHEMDMTQEVGTVNFPISCTSEAQDGFNHGMALLHSFEYAAAIESFNTVTELDPSCAMAHWGVAMSLVEPLWAPPTSQMLVDGWAAVEKAMAAGAKTEREQAYIDAIAAFYKDSDTLDHRTRSLAYEQAMAQLVQDYPDDTEAKLFYALALLATADPTDKSYTNQRQAVAILEQLLAEQPNHPGVAHYLIHSNDYPALADQGLDAALRFAVIAPAAPHALHMPSHIFTRLGYWQESIDTNLAGASAAKARLPEGDEQRTSSQAVLHPMDYMMYGYLQMGQDEAAKDLLDEMHAIESVHGENLGAAYALAAMPARYVLERGQWAEAAALTLHPQGLAWEKFPQAEAVLVFARALGAARSGDVEAARQELDRLHALREEMLTNKQDYWAGQAVIQSREVEAWIALAEGSDEAALALMREAVALEDATDKHPVTPGPIVPAHELLGEMLLELNQPEEALAEFEASHVVEPNRFRGLYGAARAAEIAGEVEQARSYYEELVALAETSSSERPELTAAKEFLAQ